MVHRQLMSFLTHFILSKPVSGHITVKALPNITDNIRRSIKQKSLTILILLDFSNAFNRAILRGRSQP